MVDRKYGTKVMKITHSLWELELPPFVKAITSALIKLKRG